LALNRRRKPLQRPLKLNSAFANSPQNL